MQDFKLIDYDHSQNGTLCNGVISNLDEGLEAVWTFDLYGRPVAHVEPFSEVTFAALWNGIAASLSRRGVFWRHLVTDPCRPIDTVASHIIVASSLEGGQGRFLTFMVPADEADPEFKSWLVALGVPASAAGAAPSSLLPNVHR